MPLGFHFRLALVSFTLLAFVEGQPSAATPPIARSMKPINEDKPATEELKNMDNLHNVYPSSQHPSVPLVNYSERAASNNVSSSISADSVRSRRPLSRRLTAPTSSKRALNFVYPYPVSGGTTSSRSVKLMMRDNSSYTPQRFGPVEAGRSVGPNYLNQDQYKRYVTGLNPLPGNQTDGSSQHNGRILALSKSTIQVNERGSIVRGIWDWINPAESVSSPLVETKPTVRYPADPWKPSIVSDVHPINGAYSVALKPNQGEQVQTDRGSTRQEDQATNSKPVTLVRVKPGHASEVLRLFGNTNTNIPNQDTKGQGQFQDIRRTSESDPIVTHLPTLSSATSRGVIYHPRPTSTGSSVVQSHTTLELSQSKPNSASGASQIVGSTVSTSSASQPAWTYLDSPKMEGDEAKFPGHSPMTVSSSNHTSQTNVEKLGVLDHAQKTGRVQWLVVKPYPASNSARETVYDSVHLSPSTQSNSTSKQKSSTRSHAVRDDKFSSQLQASVQMIPHTVPNVMQYDTRGTGSIDRRIQYSEVQPFQVAPNSRSQGFQTFAVYQTGYQTSNFPNSQAIATSPSVEGTSGKQRYPPSDHTHYKIKGFAKLNLKKSFEVPGQRNISIFFRPQTLHDVRVREHGETSRKPPVTFSRFQQNIEVPSISGSAVLALDSDQSIENYLARNSSEISKSIATDAEKTPSLPISISAVNSSSPGNATGGAQTFAGNIYSVHESTGHNEALSSSSRPQTATEDKNMSVSDSISASLESITPQHGIRHIQAKMMTGLPFPTEVLQINSAKEHLQENEDQTKTVQQMSSYINATQSSRPTSSSVVVVAKRVKVHHKDRSTASLNTYENSQLPIYRSPIIRRKSTKRLLANVSRDISKDDPKPENHGMVNQSAEIKVQTESSPAEAEVDPSYSDLKSTNISVNSNPVQSIDSQQSLSSSQSKFKQIKPLSIKYLDVASSAAISIHKPVHAGPMINGTELHSDSDSLPTSTLVPTTTEPNSATERDDVTEAAHLLRAGKEPTASVLHTFP